MQVGAAARREEPHPSGCWRWGMSQLGLQISQDAVLSQLNLRIACSIRFYFPAPYWFLAYWNNVLLNQWDEISSPVKTADVIFSLLMVTAADHCQVQRGWKCVWGQRRCSSAEEEVDRGHRVWHGGKTDPCAWTIHCSSIGRTYSDVIPHNMSPHAIHFSGINEVSCILKSYLLVNYEII